MNSGIIDLGRALSSRGLIDSLSGNVSCLHDGKIWISASGANCGNLKITDLVDLEDVRRSSEWKIHKKIYEQFQNVGVVVHTHSVNCAALSCLGVDIPSFHYMVAIAGGYNIRTSEYATYGSMKLAENVISALRERKACLIAHHGMVCYEENAERALRLAVEVEKLAEMYLKILSTHKKPLSYLSYDEMKQVRYQLNWYDKNIDKEVEMIEKAGTGLEA